MRAAMRITLLLIALLVSASAAADEPLRITVAGQTGVGGYRQIGVNLGGIQRYATGVTMHNLVLDGGFEPLVRSSVLLTSGGEPDRVYIERDAASIDWPSGTFDGGRFEVASGAAVDRSGTILSYAHEGNRLVFVLDDDGDGEADAGPIVGEGDVLFVRAEEEGGSCSRAWTCAGDTALDPDEDAGGGSQALRFGEGGGSATFYMDSSWRDGDPSSGKLRLVEGNVLLGLSGRGEGQVTVSFFREGQDPFCEDSYALGDGWQEFDGGCPVLAGTDDPTVPSDGEYRPILGVRIESDGAGEVWVDDIEVAILEEDAGDTPFARTTVEALEQLQPGVLRMHGGQLGSDLEYLLADPAGRGTSRYRPTDGGGSYAYSLPDFLGLCERLGAAPWVVLPPALMQDEIDDLVAFLTDPGRGGTAWTGRFSTIYLEFGNEGWGGATPDDPFWGASFDGGTRLGEVAARAFERMRSHHGFDPDRIQLVIGGQAAWLDQNVAIEEASDQHDALAIAPYLLGDPDDLGEDDDAFVAWAMASAQRSVEELTPLAEIVAERGHELLLYEFNFHTTQGATASDVRNRWVTSRVSGEALALHLMRYARDLPAAAQNLFSLAGYSYAYQPGEYVRLWGITRDLTATGRRRPALLALEMVNEALRGSEVDVTLEDVPNSWTHEGLEVPWIEAFAFVHSDEYVVLLFNTSPDQARDVVLTMPFDEIEWTEGSRLSGAPLDSNEDADLVFRSSSGWAEESLSGTLPPSSLTVLQVEEFIDCNDQDDDDDGGDDDAAGDDDSAGDGPQGDDCSCSAVGGPAPPYALLVMAALWMARRR